MQSPPLPIMNSEASGWNTCSQDSNSTSSAGSSPVDGLTVHTPSSVTSSRRSSLSSCPSDTPSAYYRDPRSSSTGRSSRRKDQNKIPRPRNAFIVFRCEYAQRHALENKGERPPTPEKTLSQRAGALWGSMTKAEKEPYKTKAELERIAHQLAYPDYKYRPNRKGLPRRRTSGSVSRREQVEMLMKASAERSHHDSGSECDSPVSLTSCSPEPGDQAHALPAESHTLAHRRSISLPHLNPDPYPFAHTYFLKPTSCVSSPGGGPQRTARRAVSASYRHQPSHIPPPDLGFELDYGPGTEPYVYRPGQSSTSTMSLPEILTLPECLSLEEAAAEGFVSPYDVSPISPVSPASPAASSLEPAMQDYFPPPPQSVPLYHRRQRSNTAPSTLSPLTVVSSSLQNWNGEAGNAPAAVQAQELPTFAFTPDTSSVMTPTSSTIPMQTQCGEFVCSVPFMPEDGSLLLPATTVDFDRTPRRADFPLNVQEQYVPQYTNPAAPMVTSYPGSVPRTDTGLSMASYDLESYMAGLDALSITSAPYDMSPFQNVDFDDFIYIGHD